MTLRLSRDLMELGLDGELNERISELGSSFIGEDTVLALDISDIQKPYAKKMEYLEKVLDGSEGEIGNGYWFVGVTGADIRREGVIPLHNHLYSSIAPDFESENKEMLKAVDMVCGKVGSRGIWVIDRGGDRRTLFKELIKRKLRFVIRLVGSRSAGTSTGSVGGEGLVTDTILNLSRTLKTPYQTQVIRIKEGYEDKFNIQLGSCKVRLDFYSEPLTLVVLKGFGEKPMMLLTNLEVEETKKGAWKVVEIYLLRWKCEETFRFIKQSYNLEDIRVRGYQSLKNMVALILSVAFFVAIFLGRTLRLKILYQCECIKRKVIVISRRFFGIPLFCYYAISDGVFRIFNRFPIKKPPKQIDQIQMLQLEIPLFSDS